MPAFFRRIRKQFSDEKNPMKYLRYAMGEIMLVVLGILIALQINNWNDARKSKIDEISTLNNLRDGLQKDLEGFDLSIWYCERAKKSMDLLIVWLGSGRDYQDSLKYHFGNTNSLITPTINRGTFESLKSKDLNLISNEQLRHQLVNFFDYMAIAMVSQNIRYRVLLEEASSAIYNSRFDEFWGTAKDSVENNHIVSINGRDVRVLDPEMVPLDFKALKIDQEYLYTLKTLKNRHRYYMLEAISATKDSMIALIRNIDKTLLKMENL